MPATVIKINAWVMRRAEMLNRDIVKPMIPDNMFMQSHIMAEVLSSTVESL
jgi:hypothetical protein